MKNGFALVEIMIVIAIGILLVAAAIPSYMKAKEADEIRKQNKQNIVKMTTLETLEKGAPIKIFTDADREFMLARHDVKVQKERAEKEKKIATMSLNSPENIMRAKQMEEKRKEYKVTKLFEVEGCKVYSFYVYGENHFISIPQSNIVK